MGQQGLGVFTVKNEQAIEINVIIPHHNGDHLLRNCLDALQKQSFQDFDIVVVDDGSEDDSARICSNYDKTTCIRLDRNRGFAAAVNEGIRNTKAPYVALLNNDARPADDWLESLFEALQKNEAFSYGASRVLCSSRPELLDRAGDLYTYAGVALMRGHLELAEERYSREEEVFGASAVAALYRRSLFEDIGLFDEDYFCIYEDVDLCLRARLRGHRCLYVPKAKVHHIGSATISKSSDRMTEFGQVNLERTYLKNMPWPIFLRYGHHHLIFNLFAFLQSLTAGKTLAYIRAKFKVVTLLPQILQQRKRVQAKRTIPWRDLCRGFSKGWFKMKILQWRRRNLGNLPNETKGKDCSLEENRALR